MKKIISLLMVSLMILSLCTLIACDKDNSNNEEPALKLGLGLVTTTSVSNAEGETNGQGQVTITAAAVLVDNDGKIVKAFIDCSDNTVGYTADGKAVANSSFATKYEQGANYGMTNPNYGGTATKEWFEQANIFCGLVAGKTVTEVNALVAENAKGTEEVITAGCTIYVSDFAKAIEKAVANATASNATKNDTVKLGVSTSQTTTDADGETDGSNKLETTFFAAAVDANGKIVAASSDSVEVTFTFDATGASTYDATKAVASKKEKGANYGMTNPLYGGTAKKEWFEQAAAFDAACIGKTAAEVKDLMGPDYKGNADVQAAGCTIYVSGLVAAASKVK